MPADSLSPSPELFPADVADLSEVKLDSPRAQSDSKTESASSSTPTPQTIAAPSLSSKKSEVVASIHTPYRTIVESVVPPEKDELVTKKTSEQGYLLLTSGESYDNFGQYQPSLTEKQEAWKKTYFDLALIAIAKGNLSLLRVLLGPDLRPIKNKQEQRWKAKQSAGDYLALQLAFTKEINLILEQCRLRAWHGQILDAYGKKLEKNNLSKETFEKFCTRYSKVQIECLRVGIKFYSESINHDPYLIDGFDAYAEDVQEQLGESDNIVLSTAKEKSREEKNTTSFLLGPLEVIKYLETALDKFIEEMKEQRSIEIAKEFETAVKENGFSSNWVFKRFKQPVLDIYRSKLERVKAEILATKCLDDFQFAAPQRFLSREKANSVVGNLSHLQAQFWVLSGALEEKVVKCKSEMDALIVKLTEEYQKQCKAEIEKYKSFGRGILQTYPFVALMRGCDNETILSEIIESDLTVGVDDVRNQFGNTMVHYAYKASFEAKASQAEADALKILRYLYSRGGTPFIRNNDGLKLRPLAFAQMSSHAQPVSTNNATTESGAVCQEIYGDLLNWPNVIALLESALTHSDFQSAVKRVLLGYAKEKYNLIFKDGRQILHVAYNWDILTIHRLQEIASLIDALHLSSVELTDAILTERIACLVKQAKTGVWKRSSLCDHLAKLLKQKEAGQLVFCTDSIEMVINDKRDALLQEVQQERNDLAGKLVREQKENTAMRDRVAQLEAQLAAKPQSGRSNAEAISVLGLMATMPRTSVPQSDVASDANTISSTNDNGVGRNIMEAKAEDAKTSSALSSRVPS